MTRACKTVPIALGDRSYDIIIGRALLARTPRHLPFKLEGRKVFVICDTNTAQYATQLRDSLAAENVALCEILTLPFGEATKSYDHLRQCHDWMLGYKINRNSVVFAVGGGVIGDLAGYAAATILRGVPYVQVPTTVLSQVDSSVGGKTGINTSYGKNLVGAFYQPVAVLADLDTLDTLPQREILAGYAEIVKYGLLGDFAFFEWLEQHGKDVIARDDAALSYAIETSCNAKAAIVEADEREGGKRALLNLGHTFGHALEAAAGYDGSLLHGEGVAIGTMMAFSLSAKMGLCTGQDVARVKAHFDSLALPTDATQIAATPETLIDTMRGDKKAVGDTMVFILNTAIGESFISKTVNERDVHDILTQSLAGVV